MEASEEKKLLALCREVQVCDDTLGARSDHEGTEDGPTYRLFNQGAEKFDRICEITIENHRAALRVWQKLRRFNRRMKARG